MNRILRNKQLLESLCKAQTRIKDFYVENNPPKTLNEDLNIISNLERQLRLKEVPFKSFEKIVEEERSLRDYDVSLYWIAVLPTLFLFMKH
jgi:hypothetical protein